MNNLSRIAIATIFLASLLSIGWRTHAAESNTVNQMINVKETREIDSLIQNIQNKVLKAKELIKKNAKKLTEEQNNTVNVHLNNLLNAEEVANSIKNDLSAKKINNEIAIQNLKSLNPMVDENYKNISNITRKAK